MDKNFKEYLMESAKQYKYTLKIAIDEIDNRMLDRNEHCLGPYQLTSASSFKKTPIQESPLDFPNVKNYAVHISELVMEYPASRDFLETFISNKLGISEQQVVVYSENDPRKFETELHLERSNPDYKKNYKAVLGDDEYPQTEDVETLDDQKNRLFDDAANSVEARVDKSFYKWDMSAYGNAKLHEDPSDNDGSIPDNYSSDFIDSAPKESFSLFGRIKKAEF